MKTLFSCIISFCCMITGVAYVFAQNTFPATGNAGIGTTAPLANLEIKANQSNALMLDPFGSGVGKTSEIRFRELNANGSNCVGLKAPDDIAVNTIWVLPAVDGSAGQILSTDGAGNLAWKSLASDANKSLSNLTSPTKVNVSLIPDVGGGKDLGSSVRPWASLFISESISNANDRIFSLLGSNNIFIGAGSGINNSGAFNTFVGSHSGKNNSSGASNTVVGSSTLYFNTTGSSNVAFGSYSLYSNTTGYSNVANGSTTLYSNTSGYNNVATGTQSLYSNTTGYENTACGNSSLNNNTTGNNNSAVGSYSLSSNLTGANNAATGYQSLYSNNGSSNTADGYQSLYSNNTGSNNTASGSGSLYSNSTGQNNVAFGYQALYNSNGSSNTASGQQALYNNTGSQNTATGYQALRSNTSGNYNTAEGYGAGSYNDNSNYCTFLGYDADQVSTTDLSNATAVGWTARLTASDQVRIGNSTITSIGGYANWSNVSDGRFKKEIQEDVPGLAFINKLRPVTYHLDVTGIRSFIGEDRNDTNQEDKIKTEQTKEVKEAIVAKEKIVYSGFVAQEVETAAREVGYDFSGVDAPKNENDLYGLRYNEFVVPLVKAVQELSSDNIRSKQEVEELTAEVSELKSQLEELKSLAANQVSRNTQMSDQIQLGQNIPNPFDRSTVIPFRLPSNCQSAYVAVSESSTGRIISLLPVSCNQTFVTIESGTLSIGLYSYSLYLDQRLVSTKQMEIYR